MCLLSSSKCVEGYFEHQVTKVYQKNHQFFAKGIQVQSFEVFYDLCFTYIMTSNLVKRIMFELHGLCTYNLFKEWFVMAEDVQLKLLLPGSFPGIFSLH